MPEKIPPDPVSVPPKSSDTKSQADAPRSVYDPALGGASGQSPAEAMQHIGPELRQDVKRVVGGIKDALTAAKRKNHDPNYRPLVLPDNEPADPVVSAEASPQAATEPETSAEEPAAPVAPGASRPPSAPIEDGRYARANAVVEKADAEALKKALAEQMLKPAEIKRLWKSELANTVSQIGLEGSVADKEKQGPQNYEEFKKGVAEETRAAAKDIYAQLQQADEKYADAYKRFYYNNNVLERIVRRLRPLGAASMEINDARNERDSKRLEAKAAFETAARERWEAAGKSPEWIERALSKYEGLHLYKDVIEPGTNRDIQLRAEALGEKVPDTIQKGLKWMKKADEGYTNWFVSRAEKFGIKPEAAKKLAPFARMVGSAVLVSGGAAAAGAFATVGGLAAVGVTTWSIWKALQATGAGFIVAEAVGGAYEHLIGKKAQANAVMSEAEIRAELKRMSQNKELTLEVLQAIERRRLQLKERGSDETLAQKVAFVKVLVGVGVGVGTAMALTEMHQADAAAKVAEQIGPVDEPRMPDGVGADAPSGPSGGAPDVAPSAEGLPAPGAESSVPPTVAETLPQQPETVPAAENAQAGTPAESAAPVSVESIPQEARSLSVSGGINNADRLVGHFGLQLQETFAGQEPPASVKSFLELLRTDEGASLLAGEDKATLALGLQTPDGLSAVMQAGDTIGLNAEGQIVLERPGTQLSAVLVDADGTVATTHTFPMEGAPVADAPAPVENTPVEVPQQPAEAVPAEPPSAAVPESVPTDVPAQPEAAPAAAPPASETPAPAEPVPAPAETAAPSEAPAPAEAAPVPEPAAPEQPPVAAESLANRYGIEVNPQVADLYADENGTLIVYGGELPERMEIARDYLKVHPDAVLYFDSSMPDPITSQMIAHITQAFVDPSTGIPQMPNEAMNPQLQGYTLPTADDLARRVDR